MPWFSAGRFLWPGSGGRGWMPTMLRKVLSLSGGFGSVGAWDIVSPSSRSRMLR